MNINECGCRPYEWLGLDGDRCIRVIPRQFIEVMTDLEQNYQGPKLQNWKFLYPMNGYF